MEEVLPLGTTVYVDSTARSNLTEFAANYPNL